MKLLSIDVGIKNMGLCLLDYTIDNLIESKSKSKLSFIKIINWKNINILDTHIKNSDKHNKKCHALLKNKNNCKSNALYYCDFESNNVFFCKKHSKETNQFFFNDPQYTKASLQSKTIEQLLEFKTHYNILIDNHALENKIKKNCKVYKKELVDGLYDYIKLHKLKKIEKTTSKDINLVETGIIIMNEFDAWLGPYINDIDCVIIENQISPIANRMKTIQGMISQYFIMKNITNIEFISSSNKLNIDFQRDGDESILKTIEAIPSGKEYYKERKNAGLQLVFEILKIMEYEGNCSLFLIDLYKSSKKKDDLADSLLQGISYIYKLK